MKILPPKKQIRAEKEEQKRIQILEGVKLAQRVDELRRTSAELEKNHELFLKASAVELSKATAELEEKRDGLRTEVSRLEKERGLLKRPLDDEWATLKDAEERFKKEKSDFLIEKDELSQTKKGVEEESKRIAEERSRIEEEKRETDKNLRNSAELREQAEGINAEATRIKESNDMFYAEKERQYAQREANIKYEELANENYKKILDQREEKLRIKEIQLIDREATLERAFNRLKQ